MKTTQELLASLFEGKKEEYDNEGDMAKDQLFTIADAAEEIHDMLEDDTNLPEWVQNKITKAADYLDSVRDYLAAENVDDADMEDDEDDMNESKTLTVQKASDSVLKVLGQKSAINFINHLKPGTNKNVTWDQVNAALVKQGVKPQHIAKISINALKEEVENIEEGLNHDRYMRSHGKKASGRGTWLFTTKRAGDVDYKNSKEFFQGPANTTVDDAAKLAQKSLGTKDVYVMESLESVNEVSTKTLSSYLRKAASSSDDVKKRLPGIQKAASKLNKKTAGMPKVGPHAPMRAEEVNNEGIDPSHKKILDKEKNKVAKQPKNEYDRKVDAYLKKKYQKEEVELDEAAFAATMKKAIAAHERGDHKRAKYHLDNAKTARYAMKSTEITKNKDMLDKYKELSAKHSEMKEEVELDEAMKGHGFSSSDYMRGASGSRPTSGQKEYQGKEIKSFHPNKEKEAREYAKKHGYVVKKKELPKGSGNITHTWDIHKEEAEITEKLSVSDGMGAWISDFKKSDAPQFKGKDEKERRDMAIAAFMSAKRDQKESVQESTDKDYIEQKLADADINALVKGSTVMVDKADLLKAKAIVKKLGYNHKVMPGLNA